jgi:hypothetical protein
MAIQIQGNGGVVADVDGTTFRALRVTVRPINYGSLGMYRSGAVSGTIGASMTANAEFFQFRWPDATNLAVVYKVAVSASAIPTSAIVATLQSLVMTAARAWTAAGTGGTRLTLTGNNSKLRTSMGTSLVNDAGIATTGSLAVGTKTLDTNSLGALAYMVTSLTVSSAAIGPNLFDNTILFDADGEGFHPLVCAQNEGFVVRNGAVAMTAGMTWNLAVNVVWAEVAAF